MKKYSAAITSSLLWVQESRKTAQYIIDGLTRDELCALSRAENIYMAPSDDRKRKIANTTYDRLSSLPKEIIQILSECDYDTAKLITLLSVMMTDDLFNDFMIEVFKEKVVIGLNVVTRNDVRIYLETKKELYDDVKKISDASFYKLGQTYIKFLIEAGLINNAKEGKVQKPYIDYQLSNLLNQHGYKDYITIITGETYL